MLGAFLEGTFFVLFARGERAALPRVVPRAQIPAAVGQNEARSRGAALLGPPLGGLLFDLGRLIPFAADALSYLASLATLLLIRTPFQEERRTERRHLLAEVREGVAWLWAHPFLRAAAILVAGSNLLFQALFLILIVVARSHGASPGTVGLMLAGGGVG